MKRGGRVNVHADGGAVLILTGAENATLTPRPPLGWPIPYAFRISLKWASFTSVVVITAVAPNDYR